MFPVLNIFGRTVGSYAVCSFIGLFAVVLVATWLAKPFRIVFEDILLTVLALAAGLLIGGHLLYAVTHIDMLIAYIRDGFPLSRFRPVMTTVFGGMVFYGGFMGAAAALLLYIRFANIPAKKELVDIFAVCVPLFHTFGRIGCFFGGCCYGIESAFGFIANNSLIPEMSHVRRFPVALLESLFNLLLFLLLLYLFRKEQKRGRLLFVYMLLYPVGRFFIEFLRADAIRGIWLGLSTSQWVSILLFTAGCIGYSRRKAAR